MVPGIKSHTCSWALAQWRLRQHKSWKPKGVRMAWKVSQESRKPPSRTGGTSQWGTDSRGRHTGEAHLNHGPSPQGRLLWGLCLATAVLQGVSLTWMGTPGSHSSSANQKTPPSSLALCVPLYKVGRALGVKALSEMWQGLPSRNKTHQTKRICNQAQASNHTGHLKRSVLQSLYSWPSPTLYGPHLG